MKKIIIIGGYGYHDTGDESQLTAIINSIKSRLPEADLLVLSDNPENTRQYHGQKTDYSLEHYMYGSFFPQKKRQNTLQRGQSIEIKNQFPKLKPISKIMKDFKTLIFALHLILNAKLMQKNKPTLFLKADLERLLLNLKNSNLLFNVGGGNITSVWRKDLHAKCLMFLLCRVFKKPLILSGQTIGPFNGTLDRWIARYALDSASLITLRENFSTQCIKQLGVTVPVVRVTADDSIMLAPSNATNSMEVLKKEHNNLNHPIIGMNIFGSYLQKSEKVEKAKLRLANLADYLADKYDATIVFVPMQQFGIADDRLIASETVALMKNKEHAFVLSKEYNDEVVKGVIAQLDLAIGFRYHFITFAVTSGVPAIGIYSNEYYSIKIAGILSLMNLEKYALSIDENSFEKLVTLTQELMLKKAQVSKMLNERTKVLKERSLLTIEYAIQILNEQDDENCFGKKATAN